MNKKNKEDNVLSALGLTSKDLKKKSLKKYYIELFKILNIDALKDIVEAKGNDLIG